MSQSEQYEGVGHTALRLALGLVQMKCIPPDDEPRPRDAVESLMDAVEAVEAVDDLPYVGVQYLRACLAFGMRPSSGEVNSSVVTADVDSGLELLETLKADTEVEQSFRAGAVAISCIIDYLFVLSQAAMEDLSKEEQEEAVRAAVLIAENSARAMGDDDRAQIGSDVLQRMSEYIGQLDEAEKVESGDSE